jgi:hypothetical protein
VGNLQYNPTEHILQAGDCKMTSCPYAQACYKDTFDVDTSKSDAESQMQTSPRKTLLTGCTKQISMGSAAEAKQW